MLNAAHAACRASDKPSTTTWCPSRSQTLAARALRRVRPCGTLSTACIIASLPVGYTVEEKLAWHMLRVTRSRKIRASFLTLEGRAAARASLPPRRAFVMFPTGRCQPPHRLSC